MGKMARKVLVGYGIDCDAVSSCLNTKDGSQPDPVDISHGIFGATVGIDRLLALCDRYNIKASWYVPAHTIESFPGQIAKIRDAGHEIGLHGYTHETVSSLSDSQERDVLCRSIETFRSFTGRSPTGWTAPSRTTSARTVHLLEEAGIQYDHSFMHHDCLMYRTPYSNYSFRPTSYKTTGSPTRPSPPPAVFKLPEKPANHTAAASSWMHPMSPPQLSSLITVPFPPQLSDQPTSPSSSCSSSTPSSPMSDPDPLYLERIWRSHFEFCYSEYSDFVFPLSLHPELSGRPAMLGMLERMIKWLNEFEGVEWCTFDDMVSMYKGKGVAGWDVIKGMGWGSSSGHTGGGTGTNASNHVGNGNGHSHSNGHIHSNGHGHLHSHGH